MLWCQATSTACAHLIHTPCCQVSPRAGVAHLHNIASAAQQQNNERLAEFSSQAARCHWFATKHRSSSRCTKLYTRMLSSSCHPVLPHRTLSGCTASTSCLLLALRVSGVNAALEEEKPITYSTTQREEERSTQNVAKARSHSQLTSNA